MTAKTLRQIYDAHECLGNFQKPTSENRRLSFQRRTLAFCSPVNLNFPNTDKSLSNFPNMTYNPNSSVLLSGSPYRCCLLSHDLGGRDMVLPMSLPTLCSQSHTFLVHSPLLCKLLPRYFAYSDSMSLLPFNFSGSFRSNSNILLSW